MKTHRVRVRGLRDEDTQGLGVCVMKTQVRGLRDEDTQG